VTLRSGLGLLLVLLLAVCAVAPAQAAPDVVLKEAATVAHGPLSLADIVEGDLNEEDYSISLGSLPEPGQVRVISRAYVQMTARRYDKEAPTFVGGPVRVRVERPQRTVSGENLRKKVEEVVREEFSLGEETEVSVDVLPDEVTMLPGPYELSLRGRNLYRSERGNQNYRFVVVQNGETMATFRVKAKINQNRRVAIASEPISRNTVIQPNMVGWEERDIGLSGGRLVGRAENLIGKKLTRSLRAGKPFKSNYLEDPIVVERRSRVTLRYTVGSMQVTTKGEAQEDGSVGDRIEVENLTSEETVVGRVINENIVEVSRNS
jgi:flagella basal body P-ring formation protein FlgA